MDPEIQNGDAQQQQQQPPQPAAAAALLNSQVPLPPKFVTSGDLASNWKKYKQIWDSFEIVTGLKNRDNGYRTATFITCIGHDALEIYNGLPFATEEEKSDINKVIELFQNYCIGETNVIYERYVFNNRVQETGETFDSFVSNLRQLSLSCNYGAMREELIRDRIVIGIADSRLRRSMLQEPKLTLQSAIERGRAAESTARQLKTMAPSDEVKAVKTDKKRAPARHAAKKAAASNWLKNCKYCGQGHERAKEKCPAYGKTCSYCHKSNHVEAKCLAKKRSRQPRTRDSRRSRGVNYCDESSDWDSELSDFESVETVTIDMTDTVNATSENNNSGSKAKLYAKMLVRNEVVKFQIDTGATVNVVDRCIVPRKCRIEDTTTRLKMYNNSPMPTIGKTRIPMINPKTKRKYKVTCVVVDNPDVKPILGLRAAQQMELVTVNTENISAVSEEPLSLRDITARCETCLSTDIKQPKETMHSHEIAERPWQNIATDICEFDNKTYLVTVDNYSNFWEIDRLYSTTAKAVIHKLKHHFARYGIPNTLVSDNATIFHSAEFRNFQKSYGFSHNYTSPHHQQANPADRAIRSVKQIMKRAKKAHQDVYLAILLHRNTPMQNYNVSPAQKFLGRRTKTTLPTREKLLKPKTQDPSVQKERTETQRAKQKFYYDRNAKDLPILQPGDTVRIQPIEKGKEWEKATVTKQTGIRSYEVKTPNNVLRRNRKFLRKSNETAPVTDLDLDKLPPYDTHEEIINRSPSPKKSPQKVTPEKSNNDGQTLRRSTRVRTQHHPYVHIPN